MKYLAAHAVVMWMVPDVQDLNGLGSGQDDDPPAGLSGKIVEPGVQLQLQLFEVLLFPGNGTVKGLPVDVIPEVKYLKADKGWLGGILAPPRYVVHRSTVLSSTQSSSTWGSRWTRLSYLLIAAADLLSALSGQFRSVSTKT